VPGILAADWAGAIMDKSGRRCVEATMGTGMKDTDFFQRALELKTPWKVTEVKMDISAKTVEVVIACEGRVWADPDSQQRLHIHGYERRRWRHLDTMQFETVLVAEVPRVKYPDGHTELVTVPWAQPHGRFSAFFEAWAIQVLTACANIAAGCELLRLDWSTGQTIMSRGVKRGLERRQLELTQVGIDEKSFGRGQDYISVMSDLRGSRVIEVVPGRDTASVCALWETLSQRQRQQVMAVAMDLSAACIAGTRLKVPDAKIVFDRFHVSALLNQAVDQVRRQENRRLLEEGDERLKGTRQSWLFNPKNLSDDRLEALAVLARQNLKTSRAWMHKENFEGFWSQPSRWGGGGYLRSWYNSAIRSRLEPIKRAARTLKEHAEGLLNYFSYRITNAVSEGLNSRIQTLKSAARGFRNFAHYRIRILFYCGKLDLYPLKAS